MCRTARVVWLCTASLALLGLLAASRLVSANGPLALLVGLVAGAALVVSGVVLAPLPRLAGRVTVGPSGHDVTIVRDSDGVAHVRAADAAGAYFGLGYVHAQERLWQMEMGRLSGQGRLAEVLGRRALPLDRFMRTLGLAPSALQAYEHLPQAARAMVEAYASGVNAYLSPRGRLRLGFEFVLLRHRPQAWSGADVVLASKHMAWSLGGTYVTELLRHDLEARLGRARALELMPPYTQFPDAAAREESAPRPGASAVAAAMGLPFEALTAPAEGAGSNLWALAPSRSAGGHTVLANDPHLPSSAPLGWYLAHLSGGELDAIGASVPGLPVILSGRNQRIAWGLTNLNPDVQDLFQERLIGSDQVATAQGPVALTKRTETLHVRGDQPLALDVYASAHGPLIHELLDSGPVSGGAGGKRKPMALQWTGLAADDTSLEAFRRLNLAGSWDDFRAALALCVAPAVNLCYADVDGNIGHHAAGRIPCRRSGDGAWPAEGWSGAHEWERFLSFDELPHSLNPAAGWLVSVNGAPASSDYAHHLGSDWVEPHRERRLREYLGACPQMALDEHARLQADTLSMHAREQMAALLGLVAADTPDLRAAHALLAAWDHDARADSAAAALFAAWTRRLPAALLAGELDGPLLANYESWTSYAQRFVQTRLAASGPAAGAAATRALAEAFAELRARLGPDQHAWRWDRLHAAVFPHLPLHNVRALRRLVSRRSPRGGDWSSLNLGTIVPQQPYLQRNIPGYRQVVDLSAPDAGCFIQALGQSGHPGSRHYDHYLADWEQGRLRPMRMSVAAVDGAAVAVLRLRSSPA